MAINIDYSPVQEIANLATQAGSNEAQWRMQELDRQTQMAKMQHDDAMQKMEFQAQTQADAQFREQHFQQALEGEKFKQGQLTLQDQMGYNMQLDKAKAAFDLQNNMSNYQKYRTQLDAESKQIKGSDILTDDQKEDTIRQRTAELAEVYGFKNTARYAAMGTQGQVVPTYDAQGNATYQVINKRTGAVRDTGVSGKPVGMMTQSQGMNLIKGLEAQLNSPAVEFLPDDERAAKTKEIQDNISTVKGMMPGGLAEKTVPQATPATKQLDSVTAAAILKEAGNDNAKAREIAKQRGYVF